MFSRKLLIFLLCLGLFTPLLLQARDTDIFLFYSKTCPHCTRERAWLSQLKEERPNLKVTEYEVGRSDTQTILRSFYKKYDVPKERWGLVPVTFTGDEYFLGFDNARGTGQDILDSLGEPASVEPSQTGEMVRLPLLGEVDTARYSLLALTALMGILDGFNVCSLSAVVFVLGLTLGLKSRKRVFLYGGLFVLTTALVYGLLIVLWYQLFSVLNAYLRWMKMAIGLLSVGGGVYFLREFMRMREWGPTCETDLEREGAVSRLKQRLQDGIGGSLGPLALAGTLLLFGAVITIVEFPCSAAVPVVYAGLLSRAGLSTASYIFYISLFVLFYLLDELIVFGVAVSKMTVWMQSPRFVVWVTLIEAAVLIILGAYYIVGF